MAYANQRTRFGAKSYVPAWKTILSGKPPLDFAGEQVKGTEKSSAPAFNLL